MKRVSSVLVLLLAITLVAASALPPAAHAVPTSGGQSGVSSAGGYTTPTSGTTGTTGGGGEQGDPGGAGDGLGADPQMRSNASVQTSGAGAVVELILQALRLLQAAG